MLRPEVEVARLRQLHALEVLDSEPDPVLDGLVRIAAAIAGCPISVVSLVDQNRQWFKARVGLGEEETSREIAFCAHAIMGDDLFEIPDTRLDARFALNPLVTSAPSIRFYAGIPLEVHGHNIGTLCVIDQRPRQLTPQQREQLADLARTVRHWLIARETQLTLKESQARLADFTQIGSDWLWECDSSGNMNWFKPASHESEPAGRELMQVMSDSRVLDELGTPRLPATTVRDLIKAGKGFSRIRVCGLRADPSHFLAISGQPRQDEAQRVVMWRGVASDVSDAVNARRSKRSIETFVSKIANHVSGVFYQYRLDADGHSSFPFASIGIESVYEVSPAEVQADASIVFSRLHPDDLAAVKAGIEISASTMQEWVQRYRVCLPKRGVRWLEGHATPERTPDGAILWHGFIRDVTERHALQTAQQAAAEAERANTAKTEFMSKVSHELRTPLNAILGFTQLMLLDQSLPAHNRKQLDHVHDAGTHLLDLVNDILDLSRIQLGQQSLSIKTVDIGASIESALRLIQPMVVKAGVLVSAMPVHSSVLADERALLQVLTNVLSNGVKYNRVGGTLHIDVRESADAVQVIVCDEGEGISAERREQLFQPFNRLGAEHGNVPGTGLGLVITRQLVSAMNGRFEIQDRTEGGTCFMIELPVSIKTQPQAS
jgi:signal transduction histidine kinase